MQVSMTPPEGSLQEATCACQAIYRCGMGGSGPVVSRHSHQDRSPVWSYRQNRRSAALSSARGVALALTTTLLFASLDGEALVVTVAR